MKSVKTEQFSIALAENQDEYNTLYINVNQKDPLVPFTACFELSAYEIAEINRTGKIYYQQCVMAKVDDDGNIVLDPNGNFLPASLFHPMSIHVTNPLSSKPDGSIYHHIQTKIENLLEHDEADLIEMFPTYQGNLTDHLTQRLKDGEVYVGSVGCEGFNPVTGCPGHSN